MYPWLKFPWRDPRFPSSDTKQAKQKQVLALSLSLSLIWFQASKMYCTQCSRRMKEGEGRGGRGRQGGIWKESSLTVQLFATS